jgi:hypothetical protein
MATKYRISKNTAGLMIGVALFVDVLQFVFGLFSLLGIIPFIGVIFGIVGWVFSAIFSAYAWFGFFTWFKIKGVGYLSKPSRVTKLVGTVLIELSPLGILPTWTIFVTSTIFETWKEDRKNADPENITTQETIDLDDESLS